MQLFLTLEKDVAKCIVTHQTLAELPSAELPCAECDASCRVPSADTKCRLPSCRVAECQGVRLNGVMRERERSNGCNTNKECVADTVQEHKG